ncbi:MAG: ImmA/IrrE family metallo-endopeptidase [Saccharofermentans sp.]|nr:ImmA/IrrE family metallo-endopeptidase [Saccharofermentans sp.]
MYRKSINPKDQKILNPNVLSGSQIESVCNVITDAYIESKTAEGIAVERIDIEELVKNQLGCTIVFESITEYDDCLAYASNGIKPLEVMRNGYRQNVLFPKNTIVLDNYLNQPKLICKKRFTIGHEAGHIIKNQLKNNNEAKFHRVNNVPVKDKDEIKDRYSITEVEANRFAACLLMPESMVAMLMEQYYGNEYIYKYADNMLSPKDSDNVCHMAKTLGVSYTAMFYRLKELGFIKEGFIESYVSDTILGDKGNE